MKQILLVLRKDFRKFWPEILLSLAITGAFVWMNPYQWRPFDPTSLPGLFRLDLQHLQILAGVVEVLLPVILKTKIVVTSIASSLLPHTQ